MNQADYFHGFRCALVKYFRILPFRRCQYCDRLARECFGLQFFVITVGIVILILLMVTLQDLPIMALEITIIVLLLIALLGFVVNKETNEIVIGYYQLKELYDERSKLLEEIKKLNEALEERVQVKTLELQIAFEKLKKLDQLKSDFFINMSHTLRTPLTSIIGYAELILHGKAGQISDMQKGFLDIIERNSRDLFRMISDILDISKLEAGELQLYPKQIPLNPLFNNLMDMMQQSAEKKKIKIEAEIDLPSNLIYADEEKLKHILINLLDNAVKYTPEGGKIKLAAQDKEREIIISVIDSGTGVPPEHREMIFDKFKQIKNLKVSGMRGVGLGLSIVKDLVKLHGGKAWVESPPFSQGNGAGSSFSFSLPKEGIKA